MSDRITPAYLKTLAAFAADTRLRMFWWGSNERSDRTFKGNELFVAKNPGMKIDGDDPPFRSIIALLLPDPRDGPQQWAIRLEQ